jgi:hypothetical protein
VAGIAALVSITRTVRAVQEVAPWRAILAVWLLPLAALIAGVFAVLAFR